MPYPVTTLPTYADIIPGIHEWAIARNLLHPDGTAHLATSWGQHSKTLEEIGEAHEALANLAACREAAATGPLQIGNRIALEVDLTAARHDLALEFGDTLVTLVLQAALQGVSFEECRAAAGHIPCPVQTWEYVDCHAKGLGTAIANYSKRTPAFIGAVARCVEDAARIELSLTGPECLAMALAKIRDRRGEIEGGVFVREKG